jgi:hypothetical protein
MAFFIAEGYVHTSDVKGYIKRLAIFALVSWPAFTLFEYGALPVMIYPVARGNISGAFEIALGSGGYMLAVFPWFGVIYTLLLSLLAVYVWDKSTDTGKRNAQLAALCILSIFGDWAVFDILYALNFFINRNDSKRKWINFIIITFIQIALVCAKSSDYIWSLYQLGIFMVPVLIGIFYNGKSGSKGRFHKWFFYIFYPAHLLIIALIKLLLNQM